MASVLAFSQKAKRFRNALNVIGASFSSLCIEDWISDRRILANCVSMPIPHSIAMT